MNNTNNHRIQWKIDNTNSKELDPVDYGRIVGAWEWGGSYGAIATQFGIGKTTVANIVKRYLETKSPLPVQRPGAKRKVSETQKNHLRLAIRRNPTDNYTEQWKSAVSSGVDICLETYKKYIKEMGFNQYKITEVPDLTPSQIKSRPAWCQQKKTGPLNNGSLLFGQMSLCLSWEREHQASMLSGFLEKV